MEIIDVYKDKPLVILGDFNIDLLSYNTNHNTDKFVNAMISNSFFPLVNKPTNFFRNSSTLIDHAWCNILNEKTQASILDISESTHKPVLTVIPTALEHFVDDSGTTDRNIRIHNVNDSTIDSFDKDFDSIVSSFNPNDDPILDKDKARLAFSKFYTKLDNIYSKHITIDTVLTSKRNKFDKPWITTGLALSCKIKNKLHNKWIKARGTTTEHVKKIEYKNYRSKLRNLIRASEINYFKSKFTKVCGDIKKAWSVINSIRCKNKATKFPSFIDVNGTIITSRRSICSEFNNYFVNVADKLNKSKYTTTQPYDFIQFLNNPSSSSIFLSPITSAEIIDIISKLDNRKSNDISPKLLKALSSSFSNVLSYLFNSCMLSGVFPDELKIAKVIPLYKAGNSNLMSNYRPISILPTLSKIFEKLIHSRIYQFLEENEVIYNYQFGFRQNHSTIHAVQTAITSVITSLNISYQSMGIFIDFSKAFDTIKHEILLSKLSHYGIRGIALDLICDYLTNRKQFVFYDNDCYSQLSDISIGVPQGSVLGPLFFIIYVNDIISCMDDSVKIILFADDTNIFISASTAEELYRKANMVLFKLKNYIDANYLHINLKKSKYMHFRSSRANISTKDLFYENFKMEKVTSIKFLGIIISETLTWDDHIKSLNNKLSKISGSLFELGKCLPKDLLRPVYFALINSQLIYGISIWGSAGSTTSLATLFSAQKKSMRTLFRIRRISKNCPGHTKPHFINKKILTVHNVYYISVLSSIFLALYSTSPKPITDCIRSYLSKRSEALLVLPKLRLSNHQKNWPYTGLKIWNSFTNICSYLGLLEKDKLIYWKHTKFKKVAKSLFFRIQTLSGTEDWYPANYNIFEVEAKKSTGILQGESGFF